MSVWVHGVDKWAEVIGRFLFGYTHDVTLEHMLSIHYEEAYI